MTLAEALSNRSDSAIDHRTDQTSNSPAPRLLSIGAEWQTEVAGGANRYTYGLAGALEQLGVAQQWVVMAERPESLGARCKVTTAARPDASLPKRLAAVRRWSRELGTDADLVTTHFALYAAPALTALRHLPHVCHFHGPWAAESAVEGGAKWSVVAKRWLERRVYHSADRVITLSRAFGELVVRDYGVDETKVRVVPGGVDVDRWAVDFDRANARQRLGWPTDRPIVFCVRRLARRMGLENLIDATKRLTDSCPDILVVIGGSGPLKDELATKVESLGLQNHVRLIGFVPEEDLPIAYRAADLSIVPTQALEGFGLIVLESLAAGTPALVTPVGGLPEVVEHFAPQLILEGASVEAIAQGMEAALNSDLALPTAEQCQQYVREKFAWPVIARRVLEVYKQAMDEH